MAATVTSNLLQAVRQAIVDTADHGRYRIGTTWRTAAIKAKQVQSNGSVHISFDVQRDSSGNPANRFQVRDKNNNVLLDKTEDVIFGFGYDYFSYRFKVGVTNVDDSE